MNKDKTSDTKDEPTGAPVPEVLKAQSDDGSQPVEPSTDTSQPKTNIRLRRNTYRPSHKATFISLAVVVVILLANAGVIAYLMATQGTTNSSKGDSSANQSEVTISPTVLNTLGVSRNTVGSSGSLLTVNPNANFNGTLTVAGSTSIAGQLRLNGSLVGTDATLGKLMAGDTTLGQLNVNGDGTITSLNVRKDLIVAGLTKLQGAVTLSQLLTVINSVNVSGNLSVGGTLSIGAFQTNNITIGGHIFTRGSAPSVSAGSGVGSYGTVTLSGNDAAGTVAVNTGTGASGGIVAYVSFVNRYSNIPHVVVSAVGAGVDGVYVNRSATGFSIGVSSISSSAGHAFDYIVMQ
jgi:hypothetical protein